MKKILSQLFIFLAFASPVCSTNLEWEKYPEALSGISSNATEPTIAIDANGNTVAAWIENDQVQSRSKLVNGNWTSPSTISTANASSINLVSDRNGNATLVWVEIDTIKASSKTLNGNWSSPTTLSNKKSSSPTLCVDDAGNVIAAWVRGENIETSTKLFQGNWNGKSTLSSNNAANPVISIGGTGNNAKAVLIWQGTSGANNALFSAAKLVTGQWTSPVLVSDPSQNAAKPSIAVDSKGNAIAIWHAYDVSGSVYSNVVVKAAERDSTTSTWNTISSLSQPGIRNPATLMTRVAFDKTGNCIALWNNSYDDETFVLETATRSVSGVWNSPVELLKPNLYAYSADLSATSSGNVAALFMFYNGVALMIQSVETNINGYLNDFWSVPITISKDSSNAYPKIAATLTDNKILAEAVWINHDISFNRLMSSTGTKTLVQPPINLNVTQSVHNFGVFSEYYNTLGWSPSPDPNAVGYLIFRNGVFIGQVDGNTLTYIDNNRSQNAPVTYSVTATDNQQTQSRTVSINFP